MHGPVFGEFLGTFILILLGNGTVANVSLSKSKGSGSGYMTVVTGYAFAVSAGIFVSLAVGGVAHLNCAVTLALVIAGVTPVSQVPGLVAGQFAGAMVASILCGLRIYTITRTHRMGRRSWEPSPPFQRFVTSHSTC